MAKRKSKKVKTPNSKITKSSTNKTGFFTENRIAIAIAVISFFSFWMFSTMSPGFYQQDEVAHFNNMKDFWYNPNVILGNWSKTGYKLIYALPSLLGSHAVTILNCIFSALAGYVSYRIAKLLDSDLAILAGIIVATQPMFFELSFRNYSEIITSVLLSAGVWAHYARKVNLSTFFLAYVCTIRQEMLPLLAIYGVYLMLNKKWLSILIGAIPIVLVNLWGGIVKNDPLYFLSSIINTSSSYAKEYPRQGFWHYLSTSEAIFGILSITLFFIYLSTRKHRKDIHWVLITPIFYFFSIHVLFAIKSLEIGPSTGGNLRYMTVISPLIATAGVMGLSDFRKMDDKKAPLIATVILMIITALYFTYDNNNIMLIDTRNWTPIFIGVLTSAIIFLPKTTLKNSYIILLLTGVALLNLSNSATTFDITPEEKAIEKAAKYYKSQVKMPQNRQGKEIMEDSHIYFDHAVFEYFTGLSRQQFPGPHLRPRKANLEKAEIGSIIVFDTHYSFRPNSHKDPTPEKYYIDRPNMYKKIYEIVSSDRRFKLVMYKKIAM